MNADRMIALICGILGAYWAAKGWFSYGFWINHGPGAGFLPVIFGIFTVILCILRLLRIDKEAVEPVDFRAIIPIGAMVVSFLAIFVVGFLPAMFLLMSIWLVKQGSYSYKFSLTMSAIVIFCIWGIFEYWLSVPFPTGLITF